MKVVSKEVKEFGEKRSYVGLEVFNIVGVNPTRKELNKLYGREDSDEDEDIEYVDEKDGYDRVKIYLYAQGRQTNRLVTMRFFITCTERFTEKEVEKDGEMVTVTKYEYINQVCQNAWTDDEDTLSDKFTHFYETDKTGNVSKLLDKKTYRKAYQGETDFYRFFKDIAKGINFNNSQTEVKFDMKRMLKGDFSQLRTFFLNQDDNTYVYPFTALNYVKHDVDNDKTYNEVYTGSVLPADFYKKLETRVSSYYKDALKEIQDSPELFDSMGFIGLPEILTVNDIYGYVDEPYELRNVTKDTTVKYFKKAANGKDYDNNAWKWFASNVTGEYGCKGFYKLTPVFEYDPRMDVAASNVPLTPDGSDY